MKDLYIPKGKILRYESLACRDIVNDGTLVVEKGIQARRISGKGIVNAGSLSCRSLSATDIEAGAITTGTLAAERVCAAEVKTSGPMVVSCCLEAAYVETPSLTVAVCQVEHLRAGNIVYLAAQRRGILMALLAGFVRRLWMTLKRHIPVDADYEPVPDEQKPAPESEAGQSSKPAGDPNAELLEDFEFKRLAAMYRLLKPYGYGLRLVCLQQQAGEPATDSVFRDAA